MAPLIQFCSPGSPTDVSLPGVAACPERIRLAIQHVRQSAMCDYSIVVLLGGCRISLGCYRLPPTALATLRHELMWADTGEAGMLK